MSGTGARRLAALALGCLVATGGGAAVRAAGAGAGATDAYAIALRRAIAAKEKAVDQALDAGAPARWEEALRLFQEADALRSTRECSYELGLAAERLHRFDLAVEAYEAAIDLGLVGPPRQRVETFIGAQAPQMARLRVDGPSGARLRIAGIERGRLPLRRPLVLFPGDVRVDVIAPGNQRSSVMVPLAAGRLEAVDLDHRPDERPLAAGDRVAAGGRAGRAPAERSEREDSLAVPLFPDDAQTPPSPSEPQPRSQPQQPPPVVAQPYPDLRVPVPPEQPPPPTSERGKPAAAWILTGTGVAVGVAAAVVLVIAQQQLSSERSALATYCATLEGTDACTTVKENHFTDAQNAVDSIATWKGVRTGGWIGVGAGVVTAAVGVLMLARDDRPAAGSAAAGARIAAAPPLLPVVAWTGDRAATSSFALGVAGRF